MSKFFFSALWASVWSKNKGGRGERALWAPSLNPPLLLRTLMSVVGEVCKEKKNSSRNRKRKKKQKLKQQQKKLTTKSNNSNNKK